jgi:sugar lactone lactonase YvrE
MLLAARTAAAQGEPPRDSTWRDHDRAARAAYTRRDYAAYRDQLLRMAALLSAHPVILYKLAGAEALLGDGDAALGRLRAWAETGLVADVAADSDLASLRGRDAFRAVAERVARNGRPISTGAPAFTIPDPQLHPEDIAYDAATRTFYVSSMKRRKIVRVDQRGTATDFVPEGADGEGTWSVLAVAVDSARRLLWATTNALGPMGGFAPADSGRGALLAYDLATGRLRGRWEAPRDRGPHELGELAVGAGGDVYVSDGRQGVLWVLRRGADALAPLVDDGTFFSPQGIAVRPDGRLFVADYVRGVAIVDPAAGAPPSRRVQWLTHPDAVPLSGVDGLALAGRRLLLVQNGTTPRRVVQLALDDALARVTASTVLESATPVLSEPTHGVVVGDAFYVIANSGWDRVAPDGSLKPGAVLEAPVVLRVPLRPLPPPTPRPAAPR